MQVTETKNEGLAREFKVVVPAATIEEQVNAKLEEIKSQVRLPGFRPGKIPAKLLRQRYGKSVMGEVLEAAVNESTSKVLADNELRPAVQPKIEVTAFDEGKDLEYDISVEVIPAIEPMDFSKLNLTREVVELDDAKVTETLDRIAAAQGTTEALKRKRKSKTGDVLVIDFLGKVGGEPFEGGKAEDYELELGSGTFIEGFEDQLTGANAGDETVVKVTFPENYGSDELAGKDAEFDVTVKEIKEKKPAEIDDELAKKLGQDTLESLKEAIRKDFGREYESVARQKMKRDLLDQLADNHSFDLPSSLVENELTGIIGQIKQAREAGQEDDETKGKSEEELTEEFREIAERRVLLGLLLAEVGRNNNIQITQDDINKVLVAEAQKYPGQEQQVIEFYKNNPQALQALQGPVYEDKVVDYIVELAKVEEKTVTVEELLKPEEEDDAPKADAKKKAPAKKAAAKKPAAKKKAADEGEE
ncbi:MULTISPECIES: trigger factor [unclassified Thalassospira]|uniref:trigger factor n=1 Tax=unclassified Thalassospira TaxID=2648997 RepID=UPI000A1FF9B3|nr:trigger factor [Thalassospira sp. MCCC 1A01428]OSQ42397.1 trigger factor [Thalassospira sp. MCCC 1A01428]